MIFLLDVNVLIALIDPAHAGHEAAHRWFEGRGNAEWATCPITENGVIRILGNPTYPNTPGSPAAIVAIIARLRTLPGHIFWPNNISLADARHVDPKLILTPSQVTDTYLLALAAAHAGQLASFDRRLATKPVKGGKSAFYLIQAR